MAEIAGAVAIVSVVANVIQLATQVSKFFQAVKDMRDPKIEIIRSSLLTERSITQDWANRIMAESGNGTWNIPTESVKEVNRMLGLMKEYWIRVEEKMALIYRQPDGRMTSRTFFNRLWFANGGFEDLKNLTDAMASMNRALLAIVPPLPAYSVGTGSRPTPQNRSNVEIPRSNLQPEDTSVTTGSQAGFQTSRNTPVIPLDRMYSESLHSLVILSQEGLNQTKLEAIHERLKQWGEGYFDGPASLNKLFESSGDPILSAIIRAFSFILLLEERLLNSTLTKFWDTSSRIKNHRVALLALLGTEVVMETALKVWADLQTLSIEIVSLSNELNTISAPQNSLRMDENRTSQPRDVITAGLDDISNNNTDDGPQNSQLDNLSVNFDVSSIHSAEEETRHLEKAVNNSVLQEIDFSASSTPDLHYTKEDVIDQISTIVDAIFGLIPAIRSLRRNYLLELERKEDVKQTELKGLSITEAQPIPSETPPEVSAAALEQHLTGSLNLASGLEQVLGNDERWAQANNQPVKLYAPIFRKERERLEEFRAAKFINRSPAEVERLLKTASGLERALSETLHEVEVKESISAGNFRASGYTDIKLSSTDTDKKIAELIDVFQTSNTALWS